MFRKAAAVALALAACFLGAEAAPLSVDAMRELTSNKNKTSTHTKPAGRDDWRQIAN